MATTPKEEFDADVLWVLKQIKKKYLSGEDICVKKDICFETTNSTLPPSTQLDVLHYLKTLGAISLQYSPFPNSVVGTAEFYKSFSLDKPFNSYISITILQPKFDEVYEKNDVLQNNITNLKSNLVFDKANGVLIFGNIRLAFHKGTLTKEGNPLKLFKFLWEVRFHERKGRNIQVGKTTQAHDVAREIGLIEYASNYARNPKTKEKLLSLIKGINKGFRSKKLPAHIVTKSGIQLVIKE